VIDNPKGGLHYTRSTGEFQSWFATDQDCLDYLDWLRWPQGFVCSRCQNPGGWLRADGSYKCASCKKETAVTAVTLFDRRRTPLTVWFAACSRRRRTASPHRALSAGSRSAPYPTAWAMLHRLGSALVYPGRDRLSGTVEVDETYGEEPGLRGGRQKGKKVLFGVAVELREPRGFGRCRLSALTDASAVSLERFVTENIEEGSTLVTDAWPSYPPAVRDRYAHKPINVKRSGQPAHVVHRVASLAKRWVAGTHQGRFDEAHLQSYLDELTFRFNCRRSRSRGLLFYRVLELAVGHDPVRFRRLVANSRSKKVPPASPERRGHPPSLDRPRADRPWRAAN